MRNWLETIIQENLPGITITLFFHNEKWKISNAEKADNFWLSFVNQKLKLSDKTHCCFTFKLIEDTVILTGARNLVTQQELFVNEVEGQLFETYPTEKYYLFDSFGKLRNLDGGNEYVNHGSVLDKNKEYLICTRLNGRIIRQKLTNEEYSDEDEIEYSIRERDFYEYGGV